MSSGEAIRLDKILRHLRLLLYPAECAFSIEIQAYSIHVDQRRSANLALQWCWSRRSSPPAIKCATQTNLRFRLPW